MKASLRKIQFHSNGYREFGLIDEYDAVYEKTGRKILNMKLDGTGIIQGVKCPIQIQFTMDEIESDILFDDLLQLKRKKEAERKAEQEAEYKEKGVKRRE